MKSWRGFTLIELLVVIAIIAIIAAMLLPAPKMKINIQGIESFSPMLAGGQSPRTDTFRA